MVESLNIQDLKQALKDMLPGATTPEESALIQRFMEQPSPDILPHLIEWRDQALDQSVFSWAVGLSHLIYAVSTEGFWEGKSIELSTN